MANSTIIEKNISIPQIDIDFIEISNHVDLYEINLKDGSQRIIRSTVIITFEDGNVNFN